MGNFHPAPCGSTDWVLGTEPEDNGSADSKDGVITNLGPARFVILGLRPEDPDYRGGL